MPSPNMLQLLHITLAWVIKDCCMMLYCEIIGSIYSVKSQKYCGHVGIIRGEKQIL